MPSGCRHCRDEQFCHTVLLVEWLTHHYSPGFVVVKARLPRLSRGRKLKGNGHGPPSYRDGLGFPDGVGVAYLIDEY